MHQARGAVQKVLQQSLLDLTLFVHRLGDILLQG